MTRNRDRTLLSLLHLGRNGALGLQLLHLLDGRQALRGRHSMTAQLLLNREDGDSLVVQFP